jgi:hypothetical protein
VAIANVQEESCTIHWRKTHPVCLPPVSKFTQPPESKEANRQSGAAHHEENKEEALAYWHDELLG